MKLIDTTINVNGASIETLLPYITPNFEIARAFLEERRATGIREPFTPDYNDARIALDTARFGLGALNRVGYNPEQLVLLNQEYLSLVRRVESTRRREPVTQ
ncbi:MAG: hypothetical protein AABX54_04225 [Nanoarchaeota archaeon]